MAFRTSKAADKAQPTTKATTPTKTARPHPAHSMLETQSATGDRTVVRLMQEGAHTQMKAEQTTEAAPVPPAPITKQERMAYVMWLLIDKYGYPEAGAAGLVGNLCAESHGLLPKIIEKASPESPMKAKNAQGVVTEFTPEEVMNRQPRVRGPLEPGVGIAQWTTANRRAGLFQHEYYGVVLGSAILNNLDAQVDYVVKELQSQFKGVDKVLKGAESVEDASDEVVFNFERPGALLKEKTLRSRTDKKVQRVLQKRRKLGMEALSAYRDLKTQLLMLKIIKG